MVSRDCAPIFFTLTAMQNNQRTSSMRRYWCYTQLEGNRKNLPCRTPQAWSLAQFVRLPFSFTLLSNLFRRLMRLCITMVGELKYLKALAKFCFGWSKLKSLSILINEPSMTIPNTPQTAKLTISHSGLTCGGKAAASNPWVFQFSMLLLLASFLLN